MKAEIEEPAEGPARRFYREALLKFNESGIPYLVGGAFALGVYSGVRRDTKDLDVFLRRKDCGRLLRFMKKAGYQAELTHPHWLGKIVQGDLLVDLIYGSGNGACEVDEEWFRHAPRGQAFGVPVRLVPAEEIIWQKAFIMERHRYDGADIAHIIRSDGARLDWRRLMDRFRENWPVLLSHLVLFSFIYPAERDAVPSWVIEELTERLRELPEEHGGRPLCRGTLLSHLEYRPDVLEWGYSDARILPAGKMTPRQVARWDAAFKGK